MPNTVIPVDVIARDHELEVKAERTTEALAKHRWHWTIDPAGPRYSIGTYAAAVGRSEQTIRRHARGYAMWLEREGGAPGAPFTLEDAFRLSEQSAEKQEFSEAIAEGSGKPIAQVARGDNRHKTNEIIERARQREERRGGRAVDHARDIAAEEARTAAANKRRREEDKQKHTRRWLELEALLTKAKKALLEAIAVSTDVNFDDEEIELLRDSLENVKGVLTLLDVQLLGTPDVDWDAELARLSGTS